MVDDDDKEMIALGRAIWRLALAGKSRDEIAEQLEISIEMLDQTLNAFRKRLGSWGDDYQRLADVERIEALLKEFLPLALRPGEDALRAGYVVLELMETQTSLLDCL
jgi:hypothetical protein